MITIRIMIMMAALGSLYAGLLSFLINILFLKIVVDPRRHAL